MRDLVAIILSIFCIKGMEISIYQITTESSGMHSHQKSILRPKSSHPKINGPFDRHQSCIHLCHHTRWIPSDSCRKRSQTSDFQSSVECLTRKTTAKSPKAIQQETSDEGQKSAINPPSALVHYKHTSPNPNWAQPTPTMAFHPPNSPPQFSRSS